MGFKPFSFRFMLYLRLPRENFRSRGADIAQTAECGPRCTYRSDL